MPNVRMPDGVVVAFPDDMPPEQIKSLIASKFPEVAQPRGPMDQQDFAQHLANGEQSKNVVRAAPPGVTGMDVASQGLSGLNEGIAIGLGAPVDLATLAINGVTGGINRVAGTSIPRIDKPVGGSESIREGILAPTIKPESDNPALQAERRIMQEMGAWAVPGGGLAAKTSKPLSALAREAPAVAMSGTGAAIAQQLSPDNPLAELAGQMIGSFTPGGVARLSKRPPKSPSMDVLRTERDAAYRAADKAGVSYSPQQYDKMLTDLVAEVRGQNISPTRHQAAYSFITDMIGRRNGKPMTLTELDQLRQEVRRDLITPSYGNPEREADAHFGEEIISAIDDLINSNATGSQAMQAARAAHSRLRKSEIIQDALIKARRRAESTGSGGNINNAIRQNIRAILDSPKKSKAFSKQELAAMESLVKQGKIENLLRLIGKLSPSGNGLMAALGIGGTALNPALASAPLAGMAAKAGADRITQGKAAQLQAMVAGKPVTPLPRLPMPRPSIIYAQGANQMQNVPAEITVRGGAR